MNSGMPLTVFSDFDGTISMPDSLEFLLEKFAPPEWKSLDELVWRGELHEREATARQVSMLRVGWQEAREALLSGVRIREGFVEFSEFCKARRLPLRIVSSGLRPLIECLLASAGVSDIEIHAHGASISGGRWTMTPYPGTRHAEHCSHCKCDHLFRSASRGEHIVYIGDGFTDVCPSRLAHTLFARDSLARECERAGRAYHSFTTFLDIERTLDSMLTSQVLPA